MKHTANRRAQCALQSCKERIEGENGNSKTRTRGNITFNAENDTATLYSANPVWIRKMDKLVEQNPERFEMYRQEKINGEVVSKSYRFPKNLITIRSKERGCTLTEEQKRASAERLRSRNTI